MGSRIWPSSQYITLWLITIKLQHLETNLHRLFSPVNILIFRKSISKLHFFGLLSRSFRTLIINISSSKVPTNTMDIHSVRNVCKLVIIFHPSWQDLCHNVDHPFENPPERVQKLTMASKSKYSTHLAHAQTKCPCARYGYFSGTAQGPWWIVSPEFQPSGQDTYWWAYTTRREDWITV